GSNPTLIDSGSPLSYSRYRTAVLREITGGSNPTPTESTGHLFHCADGSTNPGAIPSPNSIGYSRDVRMTWSGPMSSSIYTRGSILTASHSTRLSPAGR